MSGPAKETHIQKNSQLFNFCWLRRHCRHDSDMSAIVAVVCPSSGMDVLLLFLLLLLKLLILMTLKPFVVFQFVKWELFFSSWRRRRHCHYHILLLPNLFSPFDMLFFFLLQTIPSRHCVAKRSYYFDSSFFILEAIIFALTFIV